MDSGAWRPCVGQRVRVRRPAGPASLCRVLAHFAEEHGATGRIADEQACPSIQGHAYLVELDRPHPWVVTEVGPMELVARHYATDELEPLG